MACACFTRNCQSSRSVRDAPGLFCQGCARSVPTITGPPSPWFSVSVASKGLSVAVSGLESTVAGGCVSVDSKRVCRLRGGGSCGRNEARRDPCLEQVGEKRARGSKCLKEEMDALVWSFGGGADEHGAEEPHS